MKDMICSSVFFGAAFTIAAYFIGVWLQRRRGFHWLNPLVTSIAIVSAALVLFKIDYGEYCDGADIVSYLLTPATVCLAVPLYERINDLKQNAAAIAAGIIAGVITSGLFVLAVTLIFGLSREMHASLLPKSVTTAIGIGISEEIGGIAAITTISIIITGIFGNMVCERICALFKITNPVAKGVAIGTSCHACGTAKALEIGKTEGAISGLATAVAGLITVAAASVFVNLI